MDTHTDIIFRRLNIKGAYTYEERIYYDTGDVFERHNFSRDVKRVLDDEDRIVVSNKYYITAKGIFFFGVKMNNTKLIEAMMNVLTSPAEPAAVLASQALEYPPLMTPMFPSFMSFPPYPWTFPSVYQ